MHKKRYKLDVFRSISREKKGQVTIFIILGILLLIALALVVLTQREVIKLTPEEVVPTEKGKIERFITSCIDDVAGEALLKLGLQGGYINLPEDLTKNGNLHLRTSPFTVVPYWATGEDRSEPSLQQIKFRIDDYIEENLRDCLFNPQAFQEAYTLIEKTEITSDTNIANNGVTFNVHWDVEIRNKAGEVVTELINHVTESPVKLKQAYETSVKILDRELRDLKLEDLTQDLIALEHPNVPVAGVEVSCTQKKWKRDTVEETLKSLLRINLKELKIAGTEFVDFPEELPYYQNHYIWDIGEKNKDLSVKFQFEDNYPFSFDVRPGSGTYLKSNQLGGDNDLLSAICFQTWKFTYDVSYPVLVTVTDETTGYNFQTAFTVHLKNNIPDRSDTAISNTPIFFETYSDEDYCSDRPIPMTVYTNSLIDNEIVGDYFREPLDGVDISFTCLRYRCDIGESEYNFANLGDAAAFSSNFPYCAGGIVHGEKDGYKEAWSRVATAPGNEVVLDLTPLHSIPVSKIKVVKHDIATNGQLSAARDLADDELAIITLTNTKPGTVQPFHESSAVFGETLDSTISEDEKLEFLAGSDFTYSLSIDVLEETDYVGGARNNWTVDWNELANAEEITFHVISVERANEEDTFELIIGLEDGEFKAPTPEIN